jgi:hypothetical protein
VIAVQNQSLSALLGTLGQPLVAIWDKQHLVAGFRIAHCAGDLYDLLLKHAPLYGPSRSLRDLAFNLFEVPRHGAVPLA